MCRAIFTLAFIAMMLVAPAANATIVIINDTISGGVAQFTAAVNAAGGTVLSDPLSGLTSGNFWDRGSYSIASTSGSTRFIDSTYLPSGQSIGINPTSPAPTSGLTFTFDTPVNAFALEIGDWATCCFPSSLYIAFDGGSTNLIATAFSASDNPGWVAGDGFRNFIGAIDDTDTFSTVTFYGDGFGEYLVAGGTTYNATLAIGSLPGAIPEPSTLLCCLLQTQQPQHWPIKQQVQR